MALAWVAVDWGTSSLRVWGMDASGTVLFARDNDRGMGLLSRDQYEQALLDLLGDDLTDHATPVIICGMAGSRQGWAEAPYATVPCKPPSMAQAVQVPTTDARLQVSILPGIKQNAPADVMRGEETQIAGFLALNPNWDGIVCLPGTHCKWVHVSAAEVVSFQTCLTGELFSLLAKQSVLRHSIASGGWDEDAFQEAVSDALSRPEKMAARLFSLRAEGLLHDLDPVVARARLSGLVIGVELAATKPYWLGQQVALVGADRLCGPYASALQAQGVATIRTDTARMTLEGLKAALMPQKDPIQ